mgnify:CR=1 FL=1
MFIFWFSLSCLNKEMQENITAGINLKEVLMHLKKTLFNIVLKKFRV